MIRGIGPDGHGWSEEGGSDFDWLLGILQNGATALRRQGADLDALVIEQHTAALQRGQTLACLRASMTAAATLLDEADGAPIEAAVLEAHMEALAEGRQWPGMSVAFNEQDLEMRAARR